jgi:hypothetical protein
MKLLPLLPILLALPWLGCEDLLKDYQEETFTVDEFDHNACLLLAADTVSVNRNTTALDDTSFATAAETIHYLSQDSMLVLTPQDTFPWKVSLAADTAYAVLNVTGDPGTTVFFADASLRISLTSSGDMTLTPVSIAPGLETIADCPLIRTRVAFDLSAGDYLLEISGEDVNSTYMVVLNEN